MEERNTPDAFGFMKVERRKREAAKEEGIQPSIAAVLVELRRGKNSEEERISLGFDGGRVQEEKKSEGKGTHPRVSVVMKVESWKIKTGRRRETQLKVLLGTARVDRLLRRRACQG